MPDNQSGGKADNYDGQNTGMQTRSYVSSLITCKAGSRGDGGKGIIRVIFKKQV